MSGPQNVLNLGSLSFLSGSRGRVESIGLGWDAESAVKVGKRHHHTGMCSEQWPVLILIVMLS